MAVTTFKIKTTLNGRLLQIGEGMGRLLPGRASRWLLVAALLASLVTGCRSAALPQVDLSYTSVQDQPRDGPPGVRPVYIAVAPVITPRENLNSFKPLIDYVSKRLGRPVRYVPTQTYAEINEMMKYGAVDVALVCSYPYVLGREEGYMELLAFPQIKGEVTHSTYIIVPADSPARSLEDLRGKSFAFSDPLSYSGRLVPTYMLWKMGETPEGFFGRTVFTYSHANSVKAVARHIVDGASVVSAVHSYLLEKEPEYRDKVRVIATLPRTDTLPLVVRADLPADLKRQLQELFLTAHEDPAGREALAALRVERFQPPDDRVYDVIRAMLKEMRSR